MLLLEFRSVAPIYASGLFPLQPETIHFRHHAPLMTLRRSSLIARSPVSLERRMSSCLTLWEEAASNGLCPENGGRSPRWRTKASDQARSLGVSHPKDGFSSKGAQ